MIYIKGRRIILKLTNKRTIRPPASYGMIHDPDGQFLPRCEIYFGPYPKTRKKVENRPGAAIDYFGREYDVNHTEVSLPTDGVWKDAGEAIRIDYTRTGKNHHEGPYFHNFEHPVAVQRCGRIYRLVLGSCTVNWRGIVYP